ncbi:phage tail spike protein [Streptococcus entericus]|uniref:phage tail spike protein n=1 Tax=Streptococcus entericus TaxID=155680 RepID=UPI0003717BE1|nr:phage tail spike protein [Streptococcus entericus]
MLFLLDKMSRTSRWNGLPLHEASSAVVSETLNGDFKLTMSYPLTDTKVYQLLETDKLIKSPAPLLGQQLFRIREVVEGDDAVEVVAYHITDDIMRRSIKPLALHQVGCQIALSQVVIKSKSSLAPFSLSSDIASLHTFQTDKAETLYSVLLDGKHSIVGTWEGELVRDNFSLAIKARRGEDRGVVISTHKNLKRYERKQGSQSVITRIHLRSTIKEGEDDRVLSLTLDSPLINHYPYIQEAEFENNTLKTLDELRQWGEAKFRHENIDKPRDAITIEAYELDGQVVHLGDWVRLKSRKHQIDLSKQAIGYEYNALTKAYISLTFDDKASVGGSSLSSPLSSFAKEVLSAADTAQELAIKEAVDNANRAFEVAFEQGKQELEEGIEQAKAKAEVVQAEVQQAIQKVDNQAQDLSRQVVASETKTNHLLQQVGVSTSLATAAKEAADSVRQELARQLVSLATKESVSVLNRSLDDAKRDLLAKGNQLTGLVREVTQLQTDAGGLRTTVTQLERTKAGLSQQVQTLEQDLSGTKLSLKNIWVGDRNLLSDTEKMSDQNPKRNSSGTLSTMFGRAVKQVFQPANSTTIIEGYRRATTIALYGDKELIVSFYAKASTRGQVIRCQLLDNRNIIKLAETSTGHQSESGDGLVTFPITDGWLRYWIRYTFKQGCYDTPTVVLGSLDSNPSNQERWVEINSPAVYQGHHNKDWSPSEVDIKTEMATYQQTISRNLAELSGQVRTVDGGLTSLKTSYDQTKEGIKLLATKAEMSSLTGRLSTAETSITHQAGLISQRLTSSQVESLVNGKGYQTKAQVDSNITGRGYLTSSALSGYVPTTTFDNYKRETAQSIERGLIETRSLIPTKTSSVNLVLNSRINESSSNYGFGTRQVSLEAGKTYYFTARAKKTGGTSDKKTAIFLYTSNWSESYRLEFTSTVYETKSLKVMPRSAGVFLISSYWFPSGGDRSGTADVDWYLVVESDLEPTYWSPHPSDLTLAADFNQVKETAQLYERVLGRTEGDVTTNMSRQVMTSSLFQTEVKNPLTTATTKVQQLADSWAVKYLTNSGTVLSQLNVNTGGVKIQGRLIHLNGQTLIDNGVIKNAMIESLHGGKITAGSITSIILAAEAVTADKLKVDQAFFNKLMANEAYLKQLFAKNAFITQVQSVTLSANKVSGGILTALNNAMSINLNQANITFNNDATVTFNSANNALVRRKGTHTAFVHFNDVSSSSDGGVGSLYASIGVTSSGDGINSASSGRFCGARFFRGARGTAHAATVDQAEVYGDSIILKDDFSLGRGFKFTPTTIGSMIDMNYLVGAVRALARCWIHWNNIGWDPNNMDMRRAVINEYNNHMKDL